MKTIVHDIAVERDLKESAEIINAALREVERDLLPAKEQIEREYADILARLKSDTIAH